MPTYVVGDIHGCYRTLRRLLDGIEFRAAEDRIWLVGDLVNRGPRPREVLRWAFEHRESLTWVLGNHDLRLLARFLEAVPAKQGERLEDVLKAPDASELLDWMRRRPLLHSDGPHVLVHAGLLPGWSLEEAASLAREAERRLRGPEAAKVLRRSFHAGIATWPPSLQDPDRTAFLLQVLTRIRTCTSRGRLCLGFTGPPEEAPSGCRPWFSLPHRRPSDVTVYFGHWASLGLHRADGAVGLDSGCAWGGPLTALRREDGAVFQFPNVDLG